MVGLKASVCGITIVALGTSLPDTFASRTAALHDDGADAAIGNVTGKCHPSLPGPSIHENIVNDF